MVRWLRWHCPPDTGFEIRTLAGWGRARYLSVTEAPHNTNFHTWMGGKLFVSFKPPRPGTEPRTLAWKAAVLTTTLGPPPGTISNDCQLLRNGLNILYDYVQRWWLKLIFEKCTISSPWYYTVVSNIFFKSAFMSDLKLLGAYASCIKFFNFTYGYK